MELNDDDNVILDACVLSERDLLKRPPIFMAVLVNKPKIVKLCCFQGSNVLDVDSFCRDKTPLLWAIANSSVDAALALLNESVVVDKHIMMSQINQACVMQNTPLILSVAKGYTHKDDSQRTCRPQSDIIKRLLELGADVNLQDGLGFSALHYACVHQNEELIGLLLRAGADASVVNKEQETPCHLLEKTRDQRARLLYDACRIFTLEPDDIRKKGRIKKVLNKIHPQRRLDACDGPYANAQALSEVDLSKRMDNIHALLNRIEALTNRLNRKAFKQESNNQIVLDTEYVKAANKMNEVYQGIRNCVNGLDVNNSTFEEMLDALLSSQEIFEKALLDVEFSVYRNSLRNCPIFHELSICFDVIINLMDALSKKIERMISRDKTPVFANRQAFQCVLFKPAATFTARKLEELNTDMEQDIKNMLKIAQ